MAHRASRIRGEQAGLGDRRPGAGRHPAAVRIKTGGVRRRPGDGHIGQHRPAAIPGAGVCGGAEPAATARGAALRGAGDRPVVGLSGRDRGEREGRKFRGLRCRR